MSTTIQYKTLTPQESAEVQLYQCSQYGDNKMRCVAPSRFGVIVGDSAMVGYCRRHLNVALAMNPDFANAKNLDEPGNTAASTTQAGSPAPVQQGLVDSKLKETESKPQQEAAAKGDGIPATQDVGGKSVATISASTAPKTGVYPVTTTPTPLTQSGSTPQSSTPVTTTPVSPTPTASTVPTATPTPSKSTEPITASVSTK